MCESRVLEQAGLPAWSHAQRKMKCFKCAGEGESHGTSDRKGWLVLHKLFNASKIWEEKTKTFDLP